MRVKVVSKDNVASFELSFQDIYLSLRILNTELS